ncbi:Uma2 family endonuclease [Kitasatospora sp. NPDC048407]|uniref:Uma2 family endonuclease n=1 Tax=Kitasatospora sp. NPDC048407 TaxID=3364051 RepID=UPI0037179435
MCAIEPEDPYLVADFLAMETPEGYRAELVAGEIVVSPPQDGGHDTVISRVLRQVFRSGGDFDAGLRKGLIVPGGYYIPDATFTERNAMNGQPPWWVPSGVVLVLEVTSRLPLRERAIKRLGYAAAGIPLYLLVDRSVDEVVLHSIPAHGDYATTGTVPVGASLPLPEPFGFELDTAELFA